MVPARAEDDGNDDDDDDDEDEVDDFVTLEDAKDAFDTDSMVNESTIGLTPFLI